MPEGQQWWMAIGGHQVGPVTEDEIIANIRNGSVDASTLVFTTGTGNWAPLREVPPLAAHLASGPGPGRVGGRPPAVPPPPGRRAHDIDFRIEGSEMQFVEVTLDPGESAVAEAGVMMYMTNGIEMETVFGDGSGQQQGGLVGALLGAGKRILTGESLFMTVFANKGGGTERVAFAAPYAGKILGRSTSRRYGGELAFTGPGKSINAAMVGARSKARMPATGPCLRMAGPAATKTARRFTWWGRSTSSGR